MTNGKNQVAIDAMQFFKQKLNNGIYGEFVGNFDTAISALEKQIPKKPILDTIFPSGVKWWRCPVCNKIIVGCIANRPQKYCDDCGQSLDFNNSGSDTE